MSRRGKDEGSIYQRKDGRWTATITLEAKAGKRQRRSFYGKTRAEVAKKLRDAQKHRDEGAPVVSGRLTFARLADQWLETIRPSIRESTWNRYEGLLRLHAVPELGKLPVVKIGPAELSELYARKVASGLSPMSVRHLHAVLHSLFRDAARWGKTYRNVAALVSPPKASRIEMKALSKEQANTLLEAAESDRLQAMYYLAITTGMRQGELLALRWRDVDADSGSLHIRSSLQRLPHGLAFAEPKSAKSRRQVMLTEGALAALRRHRIRQNEERLWMGAAWEDHDLVFANEIGKPLDAGNVLRRSFWPLLKAAGLPRIRFHDLRHTAATLLLSQGIHVKIVSEMLGHSQISITLDLYSHVTPTMQREAAAAMDALISRR